MSQKIGNMSDDAIIQMTTTIVGGLVTCVVIVALFTNFFDKK
jgi:hypothetical protein